MIIRTANLNLYYDTFQALKNVNLSIKENLITGIIGPSGCGKSTLLRVFNRMNDLISDVRTTGSVLVDGEDIYSPVCDLIQLRKKVGMVFQRPNAFPLSVFDNVAYGPRVWGITDRKTLNDIVERSLAAVDLLDSLGGTLQKAALELSAEKQQRLCIARLLAVEPEILLMDEPCSALDPIATAKIEDLMLQLKKTYTIVIVTHNMQQAARVADEVGFMLLGEMVEFDKAKNIFTNPKDERTFGYISGRFG
ncbi:phosphate ABC transporter ATP-binding protein [candidate division WOR_3 bacterium SM23_60]|uniref:Phosphate ABC transporter ATP-binding protein n=1 Tax=candidate division WOR_3 bacterium SM23_60 TaxID=1703780 RepID=A0A0S8GP55_UNCW3|nr:MAG: phosphate ABC transporter ATP-binding protein [candidate division WOR_3 bacterium SM23_60]